VYTVKNDNKVYKTASYQEAQKGRIIETKYEPIREEWAENAVKALINHRRKYRGY
jgi:hypothetical protein